MTWRGRWRGRSARRRRPKPVTGSLGASLERCVEAMRAAAARAIATTELL
jgi:hypothetical protein